MAPTITITEEAQGYLQRNPSPALRRRLDQGVREYSAFMGGLPVTIDTFEDEGADHVQVDVCVAVAADRAAWARLRHHEFMDGWRKAHSRQERRAVGFSYRYV